MARVELSPFLGLDEYTFPTLMQEGYSPKAINVDMEGGILKSTKGFAKDPGRPSCEVLLPYYGGRQGEDHYLCVKQGNLCRMNEDGSLTLLQGGYHQSGDAMDWVNYQQNQTNILIICNGRTDPLLYDGSSVSQLSPSAPICGFAELHHERIFLSGEPTNPDRIYYSAGFAPQNWSTAEQSGFIDIPTWNGGRIRGIKSLFGDLVVFKDYDIFRIYGTYPGEFGVDQIHSSVGCASGNTIAATSEACYFISQSGLCVYNGVSAKPIANKRLEAIFHQMDFSRIGECRCHIFGQRLYMFLPIESGRIIEYDLQTGMILKKQGIMVRQFFEEQDRLSFLNQAGETCRYGRGKTFGEAAIAAIWRSKTYDLRDKSMLKAMEAVYMLGCGDGSIKITLNCDGRLYEKISSLSPEMQYYRLPVGGRGRQFYIQIENVEGSSFELDAPALMMDLEVD